MLEYSDINIVRFPIDILPDGNYTVNFLLGKYSSEYFVNTGYYFRIQEMDNDA